MKNNIYEERFSQSNPSESFEQIRKRLMDEEDIERVDWYIDRFKSLKGEMDSREAEWNIIQELYRSDRDDDTKAFVNIVQPQIEGQVSAMIDFNISATVKGKGLEDLKFAKTLDPVVREILAFNKPKALVKQAVRRYLKFGNCNLTVEWDPDAYGGFGMPVIKSKPVTRILIDGKVKDYSDLDKADFIIEPIQESYQWALRNFGEEIADAIEYGNKLTDFNSLYTVDDESSFILLKIFTKNNDEGNLQQLLISENGILLEKSDSLEPFYEFVNNRYPVFATGCYEVEEGELYRFGDGKLLYPIQKLINNIYDEIIRAVQFSVQGRTFADPASGINPDEFAESDPSKVIIAKNPSQYIKQTQGVGINMVIFSLLEQLFFKVQEITRFSSLMTGNSTGENMTATQAGIQQQQGATGVNDKKGDISGIMNDALKYAVQLCFENWNASKAFRVSEDKDDFEWIDVRQLKKIPKLKPASSAFIKKFKENNPGVDPPTYEILGDHEDETTNATKVIDFDISITLGEGLPTNKMAMYNLVLSLAQIKMIDENGQPRSLLGFTKTQKMMETILGIKIESDEEGTPSMAKLENGETIPIRTSPMVTPNIGQQASGMAQGTSLGIPMGGPQIG